MVPDSNRFSLSDSSIIYPVFDLHNKVVSEKVNASVFKAFIALFAIDESVTDISQALQAAAANGLTELSYTITREDKQLFCFYLSNNYEAAYPVFWNSYFCFDMKTGDRLTLDSLISTSRRQKFTNLVEEDIILLKETWKFEMLLNLQDHDIDSNEYDMAMSNLAYCPTTYDPDNFNLTNDTLEIIFDCGFPHYLKVLEPENIIYYDLARVSPYLRRKYKGLNHKK
jgi:hypothetical protein